MVPRRRGLMIKIWPIFKIILIIAALYLGQIILSNLSAAYSYWPLLLVFNLYLACIWPIRKIIPWTIVLGFLNDLQTSGIFGFSLIFWLLLILLVSQITSRWLTHRSIYVLVLMGYLGVLLDYWLSRITTIILIANYHQTFNISEIILLLFPVIITMAIASVTTRKIAWRQIDKYSNFST